MKKRGKEKKTGERTSKKRKRGIMEGKKICMWFTSRLPRVYTREQQTQTPLTGLLS